MEIEMDSRVEALLQELHRMASEGVYAAATRAEHMRWMAVVDRIGELEDELAGP